MLASSASNSPRYLTSPMRPPSATATALQLCNVNAYKCLSLLDHDTFSATAKARHLRRPRHHSVSVGSPSVAQRTYGLTLFRIFLDHLSERKTIPKPIIVCPWRYKRQPKATRESIGKWAPCFWSDFQSRPWIGNWSNWKAQYSPNLSGNRCDLDSPAHYQSLPKAMRQQVQ